MTENISASARDRPGLPEIDVTPEMVEAGVLRLFDYDPSFGNERDIVVAIFHAMSGRKASVLR